MSWHRVVVDVGADEVDLAADALWASGAAGIEEQAAPGEGEGQGEGGGGVRLLAGFAQRPEAEAALAALVGRGLADARVEPVTDDGLDAWRAWARPERAGPFVITPTWCDEATPEGATTLWIEPGRTFGSGSHPTTRLVLAALAEVVAPGDRVLDVGTGSGVLAVGAALAGARAVVAVDVDEASPAVAAANAERNGVGERIEASTDPLAEVAAAGPFDVVLANLLAPIVVELAADLRRATRPGGTLVVSGLLADRWQEVLGALVGFRAAPTGVRTDEGWAAIVLERIDDR